MSTENKDTTSVVETEVDLDAWFNAPGPDNIVLPTTEDKQVQPKHNLFKKETFNTDFLDEEVVVVKEEVKDAEGNVIEAGVTASASDILDEITKVVEDDEPVTASTDKTNKAGRPKTDKSGLVEFLKKRIESKEMFTFDDFDEENGDLDDYLTSLSDKDVEELWTANIDNLKQEISTNTPKEFFESLPEELQYAAKYVMDGGQDLKGLFRVLSQVEEAKALNPEDDNDQEAIVRNYLMATKFGDESEIEEEITSWKDLGVLDRKAKQFKPKLDSMQEEIVAAQLAEQEDRKKQQQAAADAYVNNTFEALRTGEINGIKLDKKVQSQLYAGLVKPQYASITGKPTNLLGHLLEKYQFVEPNYPLIAEALWLLSNPEEYRETVGKQGKNTAVEDIARKLKTEQSRKAGSTVIEEEEKKFNKKLTRPNNFFKRI